MAHAKVFSASRHLEDSRQAPSSVSIITAEEIRRYGWRTLGDALASLRGFYTSYDRSYAYLGVRGFLRPGDYTSRILLMVNGHRLNDNVYDSAFIGTEFPLDLDLIDHIEVIRGPGSSLFGTNAVLGVINVITRQATPGTTLEVSGDDSSFLGRAGRLTGSFKEGKISGILSGSFYRSAGQQELFYPEYDTPQNNNGVAVNGDGDQFVHAFADVQDGNFRLQALYGTRTKLVPTGQYGANFDDSANQVTDARYFVEGSYHREVSLGELNVRAFYDWYDWDGTNAYGGTGPGRYLLLQTGDADWTGTEATLGRKIGRQRIIVGTDYEYSLKVEQTNAIAGQLPNFVDRRQPWLAAVFAEVELNLLPKISLRLGGRSDWFDQYGNSLSPRVAVVYSPSSSTTLKYIYGRAFRAPNAYESYYSDGVSIEAPSVALKPETSGSNEVILEQGINSWLQLTVDGSSNQLENLIDQVPDPETGLSHYVNVGRDRGNALEFEIQAKRASGLEVRASYTLADAMDTVLHVRLANSPLHLAKFNGVVPISHRSFAALELLYTSAQQSYQNTVVPSSLIANGTLSTKPVWGGFEFSASCYNAFNRRWFSPAGPGLLQSEIQQDGRTYRVNMTYRFHREKATQ